VAHAATEYVHAQTNRNNARKDFTILKRDIKSPLLPVFQKSPDFKNRSLFQYQFAYSFDLSLFRRRSQTDSI
jgi:hypothetical protein